MLTQGCADRSSVNPLMSGRKGVRHRKCGRNLPPVSHPMSEILELMNAIGGGLNALVIVVSGWGNYIQYQRNNALQDKILKWSEEARDRDAEMIEKVTTAHHVSAAAIAGQGDVIKQAVRLIEDRRSEGRG